MHYNFHCKSSQIRQKIHRFPPFFHRFPTVLLRFCHGFCHYLIDKTKTPLYNYSYTLIKVERITQWESSRAFSLASLQCSLPRHYTTSIVIKHACWKRLHVILASEYSVYTVDSLYMQDPVVRDLTIIII